MHDTGCLGLVHWDDPEGWNGEGGVSVFVCVFLSLSVFMSTSQCVCPLQCVCHCVCVSLCDSHRSSSLGTWQSHGGSEECVGASL